MSSRNDTLIAILLYHGKMIEVQFVKSVLIPVLVTAVTLLSQASLEYDIQPSIEIAIIFLPHGKVSFRETLDPRP